MSLIKSYSPVNCKYNNVVMKYAEPLIIRLTSKEVCRDSDKG